MTNGTKKRIREYKEALPGLRERVVAVALLLAISLTMMVTASFAWLTISRRPSLTGVNTAVAANGSLEIALATGDGSIAPGQTQIGDSSATEGKTEVSSNITWGNLINLSDASYGLEHLTLRPAQLNTASLLDSPLYGAIYGEDGRITHLSSNFGYATWNPPADNKPGYFGVSDQMGVRAISSTKIEAVGAEALYVNMVTKAKNQNLAAANMYISLGNNSKYMPSLATMMGLYMTARMNPSNADLSNPTCAIEDIQNLRDMYAAFLDAFDAEADAIAQLINLQLFLKYGDGNYTPYTKEMVYTSTTAGLKAQGMQVSQLDQFIKDHNTIVSDLEKLKTICSSGTSLKWKDSGLNDIVNNLVNVGACTIGADNTPISSIGASNAMGYLSGTQEARITNGILYRFEERTGGYISVKNLKISATVERKGITVPASVKANIQTTASRDYNLFDNDLTYAESLNDGNYAGGIAVAEDTYGLAVDLWVRTNASGTYLTLEGNVLSTSKEVRAMGKDANGNPVELFTVTISSTDDNGEAFSYALDLYQVVTKDQNGTETVTWYNVDNHIAVTEEELNGATPLPKMETVTTVTGFEGENRVWGENQLLSVDSTTQGSGSCYVYYADTPEDQARSLKLLEAFNVAFVDGNGKLLATAVMDTQHYYAANGRVIVPLVLSPSDSINLGEDYEGKIDYAITALEKNVATRITAIVYLDGTKLTNQEVLSAADIQGHLNIQFGSSKSLNPISNEKLESAERRVSASVDKTSFNYDTATEPMTSRVTVTVDGEQAQTVTAFFMRAISATQGSREEVMTFHKDSNGKWVSDYTFTVPGNYVLRTVNLDGVDYILDNPPQVHVAGFTLASLSCTQANNNHVAIMTAANAGTVDLNLRFATDDVSKLPSSVQGRYLRDSDGSAVNIDFTYDSTTGLWSGAATFLSSGEYTLQYLVVNGEYMELDSTLWQTATVTLGMRVAVYTTSPHSFKFIPSEMADNEKLLGMQIKIYDNAGNEMRGLSGAKLTYTMKGSGIKKMDTDLSWNGSYYVGELRTEAPGIWQFGNVVVGSNVLTNATTYPTFTILSPEPPEYYDHSTEIYQYKPNNDARMNVQITNSAAASVQAKIVKSDGTEVWVDGVIGGELTTSDGKSANHWYFKVPTDANGYQDGNWTLTELKLWDVFAEDGTAYTEEAPLLINVSDKNNVTKVVSRIYVTFAQGLSKDFGKDASGKVTGVFMDSHTISNLSVDIKDFEGNPIAGVSDVKLAFVYGNNSDKYGGYTSTSLTNALADFTVTMTDSGNGIRFVHSGQTLQYAGSYAAATFSLKVGDQTFTFSGDTLPANAPVFTVWSVKPYVKVTGVNTGVTTQIDTKITWTTNWVGTPTFTSSESKTNSFSDYAATLYAKASVDASTIGNRHGFFAEPKLKLTVYGAADGYTVSMTLPAGAASAVIFERTGNGNIEEEIGKTSIIKYFGLGNRHYLEGYAGHGNVRIETMTISKGNMTYVVTLDHPIVITNPSSVDKLS